MKDDDGLCCREIDVYTRARAAEAGRSIPLAFMCAVRRVDGCAFEFHVASGDLSLFLDSLNPEHVLPFSAKHEFCEELEGLILKMKLIAAFEKFLPQMNESTER